MKIYRYKGYVIKVATPKTESTHIKLGGSLFPNKHPTRVRYFHKNVNGIGFTMKEMIDDSIKAGCEAVDMLIVKRLLGSALNIQVHDGVDQTTQSVPAE